MAARPIGLVAFDVEATGSSTPLDCVFAIGISHIAIDSTVVDSNNPDRVKILNERLRKSRLVLDLKKPVDMQWRDFWNSSGYDMTTFDEFWSKHLNVLDQLQSNEDRCKSEEGFAALLDSTLRDIESLYSSFTLLSDTLTFDIPALSSLLTKYGHLPLCKTRSGGYQGGMEVDSYTSGVLHIPIVASHEICDPRLTTIRSYRSFDIPHDHDPQNDAVTILDGFLAVNTYVHSLF